MKYQSIVRMVMAVALVFAVSMNADAQLGKLANKARKATQNVTNAKTKVDNKAAQVKNSEAVQAAQEADAAANNPQAKEDRAVAEAGGLQQYLGLDQTDAGKCLWKYYYYDGKTKNDVNAIESGGGRWGAHIDAVRMVDTMRQLKGNTAAYVSTDVRSGTHWENIEDMLEVRIPDALNQCLSFGKRDGQNLPKADKLLLDQECKRILAEVRAYMKEHPGE